MESVDREDHINRRAFLQLTSLAVGSGVLVSCSNLAPEAKVDQTNAAKTVQEFTLPPLGYAFNALEPYIDARTMELHHDKHHATYVKNLNAALKGVALQASSAEDVLRKLNDIPEAKRETVRNNAGGHVNHTMFWQIMRPGGKKEPQGELAEALKSTFGSIDEFKQKFNKVGAGRFGSGWVWLVMRKDGKLHLKSTPNQDSPILENEYPIMGNDVWEHAYYLKYQNKRADYLNAWWHVVNWDEVEKRYQQAKKQA